jgi:prephenate dehydrogenase
MGMSPGLQVTIVGLGLIGSSLGLALREAGSVGGVAGHDEDPRAIRLAKKLGAVERTDPNLVRACRAADLVILATPMGALEDLLQVLGPELRSGCVVLDTASLMTPVLDWAEEHLPDHVRFVGGNPIITAGVGGGGTGAARADLFRGGLFCLTPSSSAGAAALDMVSNLVKSLGAEPFYCDAHEHDGLLAAVEHLPSLLSFALLQAVIPSPSWREMRKVAGPTFELATRLTMTDPRAEADLFVSNRDNLLRWIDAFSGTLASFREQLAGQEAEWLGKQFTELQVQRNEWFANRRLGHWDVPRQQDLPERPGLLEGLIGSGLRKKLRGDR